MISNTVPLAIVLHSWVLSPHPFRENKKTIVQCHPSKVSAPWKSFKKPFPASFHFPQFCMERKWLSTSAMAQCRQRCVKCLDIALLALLCSRTVLMIQNTQNFGLKPISIDINDVFSFASSSH